MTAADKLRELLATRPRMPSLIDTARWWVQGAYLVRELLSELSVAGSAVCELSAAYVARGKELELVKAARDELADTALTLSQAFLPIERWRRDQERIDELKAAGAEVAPNFVDESDRCAVCAWPLAATTAEGCVRGNCSQRPPPEHIYAPERAASERAAMVRGCSCIPNAHGHLSSCPRSP